MANLVRHVLGQRSFYPIFPPPEHSAAELNLDVTHFDKLRMEQAPDVLVLPSRLKHFAKVCPRHWVPRNRGSSCCAGLQCVRGDMSLHRHQCEPRNKAE
jgi:hypothetical protein